MPHNGAKQNSIRRDKLHKIFEICANVLTFNPASAIKIRINLALGLILFTLRLSDFDCFGFIVVVEKWKETRKIADENCLQFPFGSCF